MTTSHTESWYLEKYYDHVKRNISIISWETLNKDTKEFWKIYFDEKYKNEQISEK